MLVIMAAKLVIYTFTSISSLIKYSSAKVAIFIVKFQYHFYKATIEIPRIEEKIKLDIPAGIQSDTVQKIAGKGISYLRGEGCGDEYVTIKVVTPKNLTARQKKLLEQFDKAVDDKSQTEKKNFFNMIKDFAINFYSKLITPAT